MIGRFVRAVLGEGRGSWDNWMATLQPAMLCSMLTLFEPVFPMYILYDGYFCAHYTLWLTEKLWFVWLLQCYLCQELLCAFYCYNSGSFNSLDHSSLLIIVMYLMIIYLLVLRLLLLNLLQ